jgi:hypothetical protein
MGSLKRGIWKRGTKDGEKEEEKGEEGREEYKS